MHVSCFDACARACRVNSCRDSSAIHGTGRTGARGSIFEESRHGKVRVMRQRLRQGVHDYPERQEPHF